MRSTLWKKAVKNKEVEESTVVFQILLGTNRPRNGGGMKPRAAQTPGKIISAAVIISYKVRSCQKIAEQIFDKKMKNSCADL